MGMVSVICVMRSAARLLVCDGLGVPGDTFKYNPRNGHFLATATHGYVTDWNGSASTDTPQVKIGKCSKL
jgi:hypothetical protein